MSDRAEPIQFFTRPGCPFSMYLAARLHALSIPFERRDIWSDREAAAFVRTVAGGNETVPTLVIGTAVLVAPSMQIVRAALAKHAPHLLPTRRRTPGRLRRLVDRWRGGAAT